MVKNIKIGEDVYNLLKLNKMPNESFSQELRRLIKEYQSKTRVVT